MSSLSRLFAALATLSLLGAACVTQEGATGPASTVEEVPTEETTPAKPEVELQKVTAPEGFNIMMPGQPQPQRGKVAIPGGEVETAAWTSNVDNILYSISTADYPEKIVAANPAQAFLNEGKTGLVNQLKGTITAEEDISLQGYPGKAFTVASDAGEVKARNFLVGNRLYTLLVLYNPSIGAPKADEFLTSLALVDPPPAIAGTAGAAAADAGTMTDGGMPTAPATDAGTPAAAPTTGTPDAGSPPAASPDAGTR